jgi:hypothetical protein
LIAAATVLLACDDSTSPEPSPTSPADPAPFSIAPVNPTVFVPRSVQLSTRGGSESIVTSWESSDAAVASVSASGVLGARFPGSALITARRGSQSATLLVSVSAARIEVDPSPLVLDLDATRQLKAIVRDVEGATIQGVSVSWDASDSRVASVGTNSGLVRGLSKGISSILASGGGASATVRVYVGMLPAGPLVFSRISSTANFACGLEVETGQAYCWGDGHAGALGAASSGDYPGPVDGGRSFSSLSVGSYGSCALEDQTGLAYCWGSNDQGDLGDGTRITRWEPTLVASGRIRFTSISAGGGLTCGVEAQTALGYCWGKGGSIGDGTLSQRSTPTLVASGNLRFSTMSVSSNHACGIELQTAALYCWGSNTFGELGDGTTEDRLLPTLVASPGLRFSSIELLGVERERTGRRRHYNQTSGSDPCR